MNADDVMAMVSEHLTIKEAFKLWRMLGSRVALIPHDVLQEMNEKEPGLFAPPQTDDKGNIRFPWQSESR